MYINQNGNVLNTGSLILDDIIKVNFALDKFDIPYGELGISKNLATVNTIQVKDQLTTDVSNLLARYDIVNSKLNNIVYSNNTFVIDISINNQLNRYSVNTNENTSGN